MDKKQKELLKSYFHSRENYVNMEPQNKYKDYELGVDVSKILMGIDPELVKLKKLWEFGRYEFTYLLITHPEMVKHFGYDPHPNDLWGNVRQSMLDIREKPEEELKKIGIERLNGIVKDDQYFLKSIVKEHPDLAPYIKPEIWNKLYKSDVFTILFRDPNMAKFFSGEKLNELDDENIQSLLYSHPQLSKYLDVNKIEDEHYREFYKKRIAKYIG